MTPDLVKKNGAWWSLAAVIELYDSGTFTNDNPVLWTKLADYMQSTVPPIDVDEWEYDTTSLGVERSFTSHHTFTFNYNNNVYRVNVTRINRKHLERHLNRKRDDMSYRTQWEFHDLTVNDRLLASSSDTWSFHAEWVLEPSMFTHVDDVPVTVGFWCFTWGYFREDEFVCHRSSGPAVERFRGRDVGNWDFRVHGEASRNVKYATEAVSTVDPVRLSRITKYKDPVTAYLAAHNPACPDDVKVEYMLLRGQDFADIA